MSEPCFTIGADHPSLAGHFPGRPVVPGAVLLDQAMTLVERHLGHHINRVISAKFPRPLAPGVRCLLTIDADANGHIRLRCTAGQEAVLVAVLECSQPSAAS
jgi:3-hydroxymyristoyl/3-hydroxydecanoyl-(acyl carrier protein) dehydratase